MNVRDLAAILADRYPGANGIVAVNVYTRNGRVDHEYGSAVFFENPDASEITRSVRVMDVQNAADALLAKIDAGEWEGVEAKAAPETTETP